MEPITFAKRLRAFRPLTLSSGSQSLFVTLPLTLKAPRVYLDAMAGTVKTPRQRETAKTVAMVRD
ncbi:MAG: hypothetical protein C0485_07615 [Pirellula sp.]|nr:hypothetical protein [Pirellula sp.]